MKKFNKPLALLLTLALMFSFIPSLPAALAADGQVVTFFHVNDSHGRMVSDPANNVIGIDRIAELKNSVPSSFLLDCGDTFHGLPFVTTDKGASAVELMNLAGFDYMVPGNHDFNYGYERLLELRDLADFKILSANVLGKDGENLFLPYDIVDAGGVKIGLFGLTSTETKYKTNPKNVEKLEFRCPKIQIVETVKYLKEQGCTVIVCLAHIGLDESSDPTSQDLANLVDGIDVIFDAHSHTDPDETGFLENGTLIVSAGQYENYVGRVELTLNADGAVEKSEASAISFADAQELVPDTDVAAKIDDIKALQIELLSAVAGKTSVTLDASRAPGVRTQEMPIGNLAADALRAGTGADIAITNGGGIRETIPEGDITLGQIAAVFPFGNYGVTKAVTPAILKAALEVGVGKIVLNEDGTLGGADGRFPQISGFSFKYDPSESPGSRIRQITLDDGTELDLNDAETRLILASNDFTFAGGDEYTMFVSLPTINEFESMEELFGNYIKSLGEIGSIELGRITAAQEPDDVQSEPKPPEPSPEPAPKPEPEIEPEVVLYTVVKGDNLTKIGKTYGLSWRDIYNANRDKIKNPDLIYVGQVFVIPVASKAA